MIKTEKIIIQRLNETGQTLSLAESCTGGLVGHRLTNIPGSSHCLKAGVIAYSNEAKHNILGIPKDLIEQHGAVSSPVARAMAQGIQRKTKTAYSVAITGIAGPTGARPGKPVGLVYIAIATPKKITVKKHLFNGTRTQIKTQSANQALALLLSFIKKPH